MNIYRLYKFNHYAYSVVLIDMHILFNMLPISINFMIRNSIVCFYFLAVGTRKQRSMHRENELRLINKS